MDYSTNQNKGIFRVNDWWGKASLLMGMIYLFTVRYGISFEKLIPLAILSLITIAGFASTGYLINDLFDIKEDAIAGKRNFIAVKPALIVGLIFLLSLVFVLAPWLFLPNTKFSFILIGVQLLLFLIYSVRPIRLKERGMAGIVTDALYAHGLPAFLAAYTYALAAHFTFPTTDVWILFMWQMMAGIRNILLHQSDDIDADKKSGSKNFVASISTSKFNTLLKWTTGIELLLSTFFFGVLISNNMMFAVCLLLIVVLCLAEFSFFSAKDTRSSTYKFFPNNIYEKWLPVAYLVLLATRDVRFIILLVLHVATFNFDFYVQAADWLYGRWKAVPFKGYFITARIFLSYPINYFIYYLFKIFTIDLKRENTSALAYLRKQCGFKQPQSKSGKL